MFRPNKIIQYQLARPGLSLLITLCCLAQTLTTLNCYTSKQFNDGTEKMKEMQGELSVLSKIKQEMDPNTHKPKYMIGQGNFGKVYLVPNIPNYVLKALRTNQSDDYDLIMKEISTSYEMSEIDAKLEGERVAPKFYKAMCHKRSNGYFEFYIITERFVGSMDKAAIENNDFSYRMKNMAYRMRFYQKLLTGFGEIYKNGYKHCDIKPANIFYGFDGMFEDKNEEEQVIGIKKIEYFPVFADFGMTVATDELCPGGTMAYFDPNEAQSIIVKSKDQRETIELFALALSIFEIEGLFFYNWLLREKLLENPNYIPGWVGVLWVPNLIQNDINTMKKNHKTYNLRHLMSRTLVRVQEFNNSNFSNYSVDKLQNEMVFYAHVLVYYNQLMSSDKMQKVTLSNKTQVNVYTHTNEIYQNFLGILVLMLGDNSLVDGRPLVSTTLKTVSDIVKESSEMDLLSKEQVRMAFRNNKSCLGEKSKVQKKSISNFLI